MSGRSLRVVHLSQSDQTGGANRAAYRLHRALREAGLDSLFHPGRRLSDAPDVVPAWPPLGGRAVSHLIAWLAAQEVRASSQKSSGLFSSVSLSYGMPRQQLIKSADVVCLHWIAGSFLRPAQLARLGRPLVWRLSDLWPFTGGCHYPTSCRRFECGCGSCPVLGSDDPNDLSAHGFRARARAYQTLDLTVVAPSTWIAREVRRSALLGNCRIEHIPTGVDLSLYRPRPRSEARARFGLPDDGRPIVLFGAASAISDPRKGFGHLQGALTVLPAQVAETLQVAVFGNDDLPPGAPLRAAIRYLGRVTDEQALATLYSAADLFVAPFMEDNLPNVVLESLACGTPVAAFAAGGIPDAVEHLRNGVLIPVGSAEGLAEAIEWAISDRGRLASLGDAARASAEERFDIKHCASRYSALFSELANPTRVKSVGAATQPIQDVRT